MSPFAIDESRMNGGPEQLVALDPHKPPVKSVPHQEFPRTVYKHPLKPFHTIEHRNARHELVEEEIVPTEHLTEVVVCANHRAAIDQAAADRKASPVILGCAECKAALEKALAEGWVLEPYVPSAPPRPIESLYDEQPKRKRN